MGAVMSLRGPLIRSGKTFLDVAVLAGALYLAFLARFENEVPAHVWPMLFVCLPTVVLIQLASFLCFGVPRLAWRYVSLVEAKRIFFALAAASLGLVLMRVLSVELDGKVPWAAYIRIPFGVILIDLALGFLGVLGTRVCIRLWTERTEYRAR